MTRTIFKGWSSIRLLQRHRPRAESGVTVDTGAIASAFAIRADDGRF